MLPTAPPLYVRSASALGVTARASEADKFENEMEAVKKLLELKLSPDWFVIEEF